MKFTTVIKTLLSSVALVALVSSGTAYAKGGSKSSSPPKQEKTESEGKTEKQEEKSENKQQKQETQSENKEQKQEAKSDKQDQKQENKQQKQDNKQQKEEANNDAPRSSEKKGVLKKVESDAKKSPVIKIETKEVKGVVKGSKDAEKEWLKVPGVKQEAKAEKEAIHATRTYMNNHPDVKKGVKIIGDVAATASCPECEAAKVGLNQLDKRVIKPEQEKAIANGKSGEAWGIANKVDKAADVGVSAASWGGYTYSNTEKYDKDVKALDKADKDAKKADKTAKEADKAASKSDQNAEKAKSMKDKHEANSNELAKQIDAENDPVKKNKLLNEKQNADELAEYHKSQFEEHTRAANEHRDAAQAARTDAENARRVRENVSSSSRFVSRKTFNPLDGAAAHTATWGSVAADEATKDPKNKTNSEH